MMRALLPFRSVTSSAYVMRTELGETYTVVHPVHDKYKKRQQHLAAQT
jgi:hypothetical protein